MRTGASDVARSRHRPLSAAVAVVLAVTLVVSASTSASAQTGVLEIGLPATVSMLGAGVAEATGSAAVITAVGGTTAAVATAPVTVPTAVVVGGVLAVGGVAYLGWRYVTGREKNGDQPLPQESVNDGYLTATGPVLESPSKQAKYTYTVHNAPPAGYGYYAVARYQKTDGTEVNGSVSQCVVPGSGSSFCYAAHNMFGSDVASLIGARFFRCTGTPNGTLSYSLALPNNCGTYMTSGTATESQPIALVANPGVSRPNPTRRITSSSTCSDSGGATEIVSATQTYTDNDTTYAPILVPACPEQLSHRKAWEATTVPLDTSGNPAGTEEELQHYTQPDLSAYPLCENTTCVMRLYRLMPDGAWHICTSEGTCAEWQTDPNKTQNYQCRYGTYVVSLADCTHVAVGVPAVATSEDTESCVPSGWAMFNPLEWVYKPVKCVLIWAFKPPAGYFDTKMGELRTGLEASAPGVVVGMVGSVFGGIGDLFDTGSGGCMGFPLGPIPEVGLTTVVYPIQACSGPMETATGFVRPILAGLVYLNAMKIGAWCIARSMGFDLPWKGKSSDSEGAVA